MKYDLIDQSESVIKDPTKQSGEIIRERRERGSSWSRKVHPLEVDDNIHNTSREAL